MYSIPWRNYFSPFVDQPFQLATGTTGQVWGLNEAGGSLLLGHHEGAFRVDATRATVLNNRTGTWRYLQLNDSVVIAGQYDGLSLFTRRSGGAWQFRMRLPGFDESCRILAPENDTMLWVSHPYRGVFRVQLREGYRRLTVYAMARRTGYLPTCSTMFLILENGRW